MDRLSAAKVLGVELNAARNVIRSAYIELAKQHHPDASGNSAKHQRMVEINQAYEVLTSTLVSAVPDRERSPEAWDASDFVPKAPYSFGGRDVDFGELKRGQEERTRFRVSSLADVPIEFEIYRVTSHGAALSFEPAIFTLRPGEVSWVSVLLRVGERQDPGPRKIFWSHRNSFRWHGHTIVHPGSTCTASYAVAEREAADETEAQPGGYATDAATSASRGRSAKSKSSAPGERASEHVVLGDPRRHMRRLAARRVAESVLWFTALPGLVALSIVLEVGVAAGIFGFLYVPFGFIAALMVLWERTIPTLRDLRSDPVTGNCWIREMRVNHELPSWFFFSLPIHVVKLSCSGDEFEARVRPEVYKLLEGAAYIELERFPHSHEFIRWKVTMWGSESD